MDFLKNILASCLGVFLALVCLMLVGTLFVGSLVSSATDKKVKLAPNSVLDLTLVNQIPEKTDNVADATFTLKNEKTLGLRDIQQLIRTAKTDDHIKGILLDLSMVKMGQATAHDLRQTLLDFKSGGKFIVAYAQYYTQGTYYLASVADQVYLNPMGRIDFRGFAAQIPFLKDMLDRLGVKMQIYYAGQFKSATEPLRLQKMSEPNRLQTREYLQGMYNLFLQDIAASRQISEQELMAIADNYRIRTAEDAVKYKLADALAYRDEVIDNLRQRLGLKEKEKIKAVALNEYADLKLNDKDFSSKDKIAIVYAEGSIEDGKGEPGTVGGEKYAGIIRKLREDDNVKALVLRVNSPGGSALASEEIWRELTLLKKAGKPVVVSMGDLAASGGYYISCVADSILTQPNTLTGSIGVFGIIPSIQQTLKSKAGISFDTVKTGKYAASFTPFFDMNEEEGKIMQDGIDEIYERFIKRVSDGRKMSRDSVHAIAQGRVWTGAKAVEIGLADKIGNLENAIAVASRMAGLTKYRTTEYPKAKEKFQQLIEDITGGGDDDKNLRIGNTLVRNQLGEYYPYYQMLDELKRLKGPQARLPFVLQLQ